MNRRRFVIATMATLPGIYFLSDISRAQDEPCPAGWACVDYKDEATVEIDPDMGGLQSIVVAVILNSITTFSGVTTTTQVQLADYVSNGDTYELREERVVAREGLFADAELGDVFILTEAPNGD